MKYIFCDTDNSVTTQIYKLFNDYDNVIVYNDNINVLLDYEPENIAIICPIDSMATNKTMFVKALTKKWSYLPERIYNEINAYGSKSIRNRSYLEVGSAISMLLDSAKNQYLIIVSTMYTPQKVNGTENAFYGFLAAKNMVKKINEIDPEPIKTIICPGLCTGTGKMFPRKAAAQMHNAYKSSINLDEYPDVPYFYYTSEISAEQPLLRENKEFI